LSSKLHLAALWQATSLGQYVRMEASAGRWRRYCAFSWRDAWRQWLHKV